MKVVIATPLYPPDTAEMALYVKELATRLSTSHEVTIIAYGHLPEQIPHVLIIPISKRRPVIARLFSYTAALMRESRDADLVYAQNGASVELAAGIIEFLGRKNVVMHVGDAQSNARSQKSFILRAIQRFAFERARAIVTDMPLPKPEILPLVAPPDMTAYKASWEKHLEILEHVFHHE